MNTLDLAKEIAISRLEKKKVMYVITGYYRLLPDFDCYELNIDPERLFDTNGEKVDYTKHFIEQLNKVKRNFTAVYFTNNPYVLTFLNNCILAGQLNAKGFPKVEFPIKSFHVTESANVYGQIDPETQLIDAEFVDMLSDILAREFEKLINLKISQKEPENTHKCTCKGNCNKEPIAKEILKKKKSLKKVSNSQGGTCKYCGKKFERHSANHKFCSKSCKTKYWNKERRKEGSHLHPLCDDNFDGEMH